MGRIEKGAKVEVEGQTEPMVASRDEYDNRVWVMKEREYNLRSSASDAPPGQEEPYLVLPDGALIRDFQHGFPDDGK